MPAMKAVMLTSPKGTRVTVPESLAEAYVAAGYKRQTARKPKES